MYRTQCVLSLVLLYAGLAQSFDWEIVVSVDRKLLFYSNESLTHTAENPSGWVINKIIHDPVHNRILFSDEEHIYSFYIAPKICTTLISTSNEVLAFTYDPVLELLFWSEANSKVYSSPLKNRLHNVFELKQEILLENVYAMDVDICGGFIYWVSEAEEIERTQFNGSNREIVVNSVSMNSVNIDQQAQKLYWFEQENELGYVWIKSTDLNRTNSKRIQQVAPQHSNYTNHQLTISKDHIYWYIWTIYPEDNSSIWRIPKNALNDPDETRDFLVERNLIFEINLHIGGVAVKYNIEDLTRGVQNCDRLKSLLPNNSVSNVSSDVSLLCVHGTKVTGESRCECAQGYSGERCDADLSVCHNYCFQGDCDVSAEGEPKCRCETGYSGSRCEVNGCQGYCLNNGVCSLNENKEPVCQCTAGYTGARCEVNACQGYCLNGGVCALNENREPVCQYPADVISATDKEVTSTPTPTSESTLF